MLLLEVFRVRFARVSCPRLRFVDKNSTTNPTVYPDGYMYKYRACRDDAWRPLPSSRAPSLACGSVRAAATQAADYLGPTRAPLLERVGDIQSYMQIIYIYMYITVYYSIPYSII